MLDSESVSWLDICRKFHMSNFTISSNFPEKYTLLFTWILLIPSLNLKQFNSVCILKAISRAWNIYRVLFLSVAIKESVKCLKDVTLTVCDITGHFPAFWQLVFLMHVKNRRIFERSTTFQAEGKIRTFQYWNNVVLKRVVIIWSYLESVVTYFNGKLYQRYLTRS